MKLGAFSVSLSVADLAKSKEFYEKLGFSSVGGDASQGWQIMRNDSTTIGLFQGMFDKNILTFNPGWNARCETLDEFTDVRDIQRELVNNGMTLDRTADESTTGPASIVLIDPDGNPVLIDQHV